MWEHVPVSHLRRRASELINEIERERGRVVVTRRGKPVAFILGVEDLESLEETLAIVADRRLVRSIRRSERQIARGNLATLTKEKAMSLVRKHGDRRTDAKHDE